MARWFDRGMVGLGAFEKKRRRGQRLLMRVVCPVLLQLFSLVALSSPTAPSGRLFTVLRIRSETGWEFGEIFQTVSGCLN